MRARVISASAGSGKTYSLAYKFVKDTIEHFVDKPYLYRAILAVTFTNKATEEMKRRIVKEFSDLVQRPEACNYMSDLQKELGLNQAEIVRRADSILRKILHDYSHFTILTIDKFFQRILRSFIKELGIDMNYNIELESGSLLSRGTDSLIDDMAADEELQQWIMAFVQDRIGDKSAKWDIRQDMNKLGKAIFNEKSKSAIENSISKKQLSGVVASAEKRLAEIQTQMVEISKRALAIVERAALSEDDFLDKSNSPIGFFRKTANGQFPSIGKIINKRLQGIDSWAKKPSVLQVSEELYPLLVELCCQMRPQYEKLKTSISLIKKTYRSYALLQDIYRKVREYCDEEGVMLLSETKYILSRFVANNDAPFIYEKLGNRFERFMIDEFQDTSHKEWGNFVPLLRNAMSQSDQETVLIVGDVKQSIYRWRGGDWRILSQGVNEALGDGNVRPEVKSENYRSLKEIVEFNNTVFRNRINDSDLSDFYGVVGLDNRALNEMLGKAKQQNNLSDECYKELYDVLSQAYTNYNQIHKLNPERRGYVRVETFEKEPPLGECIKSAIDCGYSFSDILILCRSKRDGALVAKQLMNFKRENDDPRYNFNIMTQELLIVGSAAISNFVIAVLRLSQDRRDSISLAIMNDYLGREYDRPLDEEDKAVLSYISQLTPEQAFERIVVAYRLDQRRGEIAYLQAIHEQVVAFCSSKVADIQLFLKMWDESGAEKSLNVESEQSTIELSTIHKAKGLEKKVVIIPYCSWQMLKTGGDVSLVWAEPGKESGELGDVGRFPIEHKKEMGQSIFSDEYYREVVYSHIDAINLLYVALTRAKEKLYVYLPMGFNEGAGYAPSLGTVATLLWQVMKQFEVQGEGFVQWAEFGDAKCSKREDGSQSKERNVPLSDYPTCDAKMSLRLPLQRYFDDDGEQVVTPRSEGVLLHGVLSQASSAADVVDILDKKRRNGEISAERASELTAIIEREFSREKVAEWFGQWDEVRCEDDILFSHQSGTRRPDRVMIKGNRAVVVDYKFGDEILGSHRRQVGEYMRLLGDMGYSKVEGYVWYLSLGEIVEIEL